MLTKPSNGQPVISDTSNIPENVADVFLYQQVAFLLLHYKQLTEANSWERDYGTS